ncbi:hypothetical protein SESBI_35855 [Sesbania bispinosa]|nr:hypothetical protein SESBI_35855 [Sesbania bispinosa]
MEEDDLIHRSTKKIKEDGHSMMDIETVRGNVDDLPNQEPVVKTSYRDKVMETKAGFELQPAEIVQMSRRNSFQIWILQE